MPFPPLERCRIAVIGLGYVGLPLAVAFGARYDTVGYDVDPERIRALEDGTDATGEIEPKALRAAERLSFTADAADLASCNVYVIAVPTPIDIHRQPDLHHLREASDMVGGLISDGDVVIFESTVYPGATEDDCIPLVEARSGLRLNKGFFAGYSPERINPGDRTRPLTKIVKVTSGSTPEAADFVDALYASVIEAGTHKASSIKVAEAAKIIENTQRDVNIALINELSVLFSHLEIDTTEVLDAAATKWNFNRLSPGLVGGHCIGVDPYYLVHKSMAAGHIPDIIRLSREINDGMARHAVTRLVKAMIRKGLRIGGARVLVLGLTFKENCADLRNTKVVDLIASLESYGMSCDIHDPAVSQQEAADITGHVLLPEVPGDGADYDAVILAVAHDALTGLGVQRLTAGMRPDGVFFDMKAAFDIAQSDLRL
ncbi:nucleotide sugar dehydrogenase [Aestuariibius insulae]|uniref:nucleotide sugar dehydrogenase n=1 Tax=Aestuariibius insulae TaxID=2058287 RepID=UPI00345EB5A8